jgi:hypothetical protein
VTKSCKVKVRKRKPLGFQESNIKTQISNPTETSFSFQKETFGFENVGKE